MTTNHAAVCARCRATHTEQHLSALDLYRRMISDGWTVDLECLCPECNGRDIKYWHFTEQTMLDIGMLSGIE